MTPLLWLFFTLAGGLGAVARYGVDSWLVKRSADSQVLRRLTLINVAGSFVLGLESLLPGLLGCGAVGGVGAGPVSPTPLCAVIPTLMVGFVGAFTTFSTAVVEAVGLVRGRGSVGFVVRWLLIMGLLCLLAFVVAVLVSSAVLHGTRL